MRRMAEPGKSEKQIAAINAGWRAMLWGTESERRVPNFETID
jgi:hypothetical protein